MDGENRGMNQFYRMYEKKKRMLEAVLFPLLLTLYPLIGIRQGLDVSDTLYSLSNFQYFTTMDGTWMVATFLANVLGSLLMCLPFGGTLIGMYFYTSLLQSVTAVLVYRSLKKRMPAVLVLAGETAALGLCWCPSVILYNYLTYLLMSYNKRTVTGTNGAITETVNLAIRSRSRAPGPGDIGIMCWPASVWEPTWRCVCRMWCRRH